MTDKYAKLFDLVKRHELELVKQELNNHTSLVFGEQPSAKELIILTEALEENNTIEQLNLNYNYIGDEGAEAIAKMLKKNKAIKTIELQNNLIEAAGAQELAEALEENNTLKHLNLSYNEIGDEGAKAIAKMLRKNKAIKTIELRGNWIVEAGIKELAEALEKNNTIKHLDSSHNNIGEEGAKAIAKMIEKNSSITYLDLKYNNIKNEGIRAIIESLGKNKSILTLGLGSFGRKIEEEEAKMLIEVLKNNCSIIQLKVYEYDTSKDSLNEINRLVEVNKKNLDGLCNEIIDAVENTKDCLSASAYKLIENIDNETIVKSVVKKLGSKADPKTIDSIEKLISNKQTYIDNISKIFGICKVEDNLFSYIGKDATARIFSFVRKEDIKREDNRENTNSR